MQADEGRKYLFEAQIYKDKLDSCKTELFQVRK
jgi:hypothetical protein